MMMEQTSTTNADDKRAVGLIRKYWRRSKSRYERILDGSGRRRRRNLETVVLGSPRRRIRSKVIWGFKILKKPKLKLRILLSPKKLLLKLRDAYVNFMLRISNSTALGVGGSAFGGGMVDVGVAGFGRRPMKEYDEKVIVEMYYKSILMRQGQVMPYIYGSAAAATASAAAAKISS